MKILLDNNIPNQLKRHLLAHLVVPARRMGWDRLVNGDLIRAAESNSLDILLTGDKKLFYQQNNEKRRIAFVVLGGTRRKAVLLAADRILAAIELSAPGSYTFVSLESEQI